MDSELHKDSELPEDSELHKGSDPPGILSCERILSQLPRFRHPRS